MHEILLFILGELAEALAEFLYSYKENHPLQIGLYAELLRKTVAQQFPGTAQLRDTF